jgi:hypothetical protein
LLKKLISFRAVQLVKAAYPTAVTVWGIIILVNDFAPQNEPFPMVFNPLPKKTESRLGQL